MNELRCYIESEPLWNAAPLLHISDGNEENEYRLVAGRIEFLGPRSTRWRPLEYGEIQQHLTLGTAVAKWLSQLYTAAKLAKVLST